MLEVISELNEMGYSFEVKDGNIMYDFIGGGKPDYRRAAQLFDSISANKTAAVEYIRSRPELAFVPVEPDGKECELFDGNAEPGLPGKPELLTNTNMTAPLGVDERSAVISQRDFLIILEEVLKLNGGDTRIINVFRRRLSKPLVKGVEYPVMLRADGDVYMLKEYEKIAGYARSGMVRFRYYKRYGCLTMRFV